MTAENFCCIIFWNVNIYPTIKVSLKNIEEKLQKIGLNLNSFEIYKYLLRNNFGSVQDISKNLKLPRTTVHENIEKLVKSGLVKQVRKNKVRILYPEGPEKLEKIVDKFIIENVYKEKGIEDSKGSIESLINEIISLPANIDKSSMEIKYLEEKKAIRNLYDEILSFKEIKSYVNTEQILTQFPENEENFYIAIRNGVKVWDLQMRSQRALDYRKLCEGLSNYYVKFFPNGTQFHAMDYLIYGDNIAIVQGGEIPTAVVIKNKYLAANSKTIYDLLWNFLPND